ncbi:hypothetical protein [Streptomyces virginiae]|uniref:hypothetical protein n=1 Tax=Streptomyces virginiae TaxID=1961 RepID=UPI002E2939B1|nr:hypothetical protein [Streptomyces virginiae]
MSGTENTIETEPETASDEGNGAATGAESGARNGKRLKAAAVVLAGLGFIIGGSLLDPDPEPSGWVVAPASSEPLYSGPGPTIDQVTADFEAATATAGLGPAAPPRSFMVPGCLATWESRRDVNDARLAMLMENLTSRQWQLTGRRKTKPTVASSLAKGTWHLTVVHEKRAGTSEFLSLLALNSTPTCEEAFKKAQADGTHPA